MNKQSCPTFSCEIYIAGPLEVAKQILRKECMREGLCVTIEPTLFIYTGGEETGYRVGLLNYPRFPIEDTSTLVDKARNIALLLLEETYQHSVLLKYNDTTEWFTKRV